MNQTAKTLLIIPTRREFSALFEEVQAPDREGELVSISDNTLASLCGFGIAAAALFTERALSNFESQFQTTPKLTLLLGIAGSYDQELCPIGSVHQASAVALHGIGVGEGEYYRSAESLGWQQSFLHPGEERWVELVPLPSGSLPTQRILSVCSGSNSPKVRNERQSRFPSARLEEMEGFSFSLACRARNASHQILRGVSNLVGDRGNWDLEHALRSLRAAVEPYL